MVTFIGNTTLFPCGAGGPTTAGTGNQPAYKYVPAGDALLLAPLQCRPCWWVFGALVTGATVLAA
eukprot:12419208-Karenia_brevis.AAC.1